VTPLFTASLLLAFASADPNPDPPIDKEGPRAAERPSPPVHTPRSVGAVRWAQPFTLQEASTWTMGRTPRSLSAGWLVEVEAPAELLQPRAIGQQVLFADASPVRALHPPLMADCAVVVVPGDSLPADVDLSTVHWYFGSTALPERMDLDHGIWEQKVAVGAGIGPIAPDEVVPAVTYVDFMGLAAAAEARFEACRTASPRDQTF